MLFTDISKQVVFTKSMAWAHENEVRLAANFPMLRRANLVQELKDNGFSVKIPNSIKLTEIIFGPKMSVEDKARLSEIAKKISDTQDSKVTLKTIDVDGSKYELLLQAFIRQ